jgi:hypothetical protein
VNDSGQYKAIGHRFTGTQEEWDAWRGAEEAFCKKVQAGELHEGESYHYMFFAGVAFAERRKSEVRI